MQALFSIHQNLKKQPNQFEHYNCTDCNITLQQSMYYIYSIFIAIVGRSGILPSFGLQQLTTRLCFVPSLDADDDRQFYCTFDVLYVCVRLIQSILFNINMYVMCDGQQLAQPQHSPLCQLIRANLILYNIIRACIPSPLFCCYLPYLLSLSLQHLVVSSTGGAHCPKLDCS